MVLGTPYPVDRPRSRLLRATFFSYLPPMFYPPESWPKAPETVKRCPKGVPIGNHFGSFGGTSENVKIMVSLWQEHHSEGWMVAIGACVGSPACEGFWLYPADRRCQTIPKYENQPQPRELNEVSGGGHAFLK